MKRLNLTFSLLALPIFLIGTLVYPTSTIKAQGVGVNSSGNSPDPSAMLDVNSHTKGVLISRMSTAERDAISSPAEGLQIFNTNTKCFEFYANGIWQTMACACNPPAAPTAG